MLAEFGIGEFFGVAALLPVFAGGLMAGSCLKMRDEAKKERLGVGFRPRSHWGGGGGASGVRVCCCSRLRC